MTYTDRHGVVWAVQRSDANPRWWVAVHPDGWQAPGVDAQTRRDALAQLRDLDQRNII